jgi:hypothetical protein
MMFALRPFGDFFVGWPETRIAKTKRCPPMMTACPLLPFMFGGARDPGFTTFAFPGRPRFHFFRRGLKRLVARISQWIRVHNRTSVRL